MDALTTKPLNLFISYALPSVLGMLAISSATIVDGFFVGNYVGASGLAAINIATPIFSLLFGLALMLAVGSSVISGKLLGEKKHKEASQIFSKTLIIMALLSVVITTLLYLNIDLILSLFGANDTLLQQSKLYLSYLLLFIPFLMLGMVLDYFVKVDNQPMLAFGALLLTSIVNIVLDYIFIVTLDQGLLGAALATGISYLVLLLALLPHFFSAKAKIHFVKPTGSWDDVVKAGGNGASEFVNESSIGITTIIFNIIMIRTFGVDGVAAYTVINYIIWISVMVSFGISDAIQPLVSQNFGAKQPQRVALFLRYAFISVVSTGTLLAFALILIPEQITAIFLNASETKSMAIALAFSALIWPSFFFNGANMVITAYFTAIHRPVPSAIIALSRSFMLPVLFVLLLPLFIEDNGIYMAIPAAEFVTLLIALSFFRLATPMQVMGYNTNNH